MNGHCDTNNKVHWKNKESWEPEAYPVHIYHIREELYLFLGF